jgi:hypothetical protein
MKLFSIISLVFSAAMVNYRFKPEEWQALKAFAAEFRALAPGWINSGEIKTSTQLEARRLELALERGIPKEYLEHPNIVNSHQRFLDEKLKGTLGLISDLHEGGRNGEGSVQVSD